MKESDRSREREENQDNSVSAFEADRAAIADYFASTQYERGSQRMRSTEDATFRDPRGGRLLRAWTLELEDEDRLSIGIAFYGFGACWLAIAVGVPYGIWFLGGFTNQNFGFWIVIVQLTFAPMQMCLSMIAVTSAMWYVSLAKRFAIAIMILVPGTAMLMFGLAQVTWIDGNDLWPRVAFQVTAFCAASALIVLPIQIWIGWSLSQARETPRRLPRVSTYQFLELTAIASVLFAIGMMVRDREIWIESLIVAIVGADHDCGTGNDRHPAEYASAVPIRRFCHCVDLHAGGGNDGQPVWFFAI